jgi:hypothetical protein
MKKTQKIAKSEALNPKSETNSKFEFSKAQNAEFAGFGHLNFGNLDLFRISILGFRIFGSVKVSLF